MKEYVPCLRCGDRTGEGSGRDSRAPRSNVANQAERYVVTMLQKPLGKLIVDVCRTEERQFEIGSDDEDGEDNTSALTRDGTPPPEYALSPSNAAEGGKADRGDGDGVEEGEEEEMETVEVRHPVSKSDTLLSIARKYAADVSHLLIKCLDMILLTKCSVVFPFLIDRSAISTHTHLTSHACTF